MKHLPGSRSLGSDINIASCHLQLSGRGRLVAKRVRNQLLAKRLVWIAWDWKWTYRSGMCSCMRVSSWYMHRPSSAMLGLNISLIL